jgi:hypothetical protein
MKFTVKGEELTSIKTDKGDWKSRRLTLLGVDEMAEQFCEVNLPADSAEVGVGKMIEVRVRKVLSIYQGNARLLGELKGVVQK